VKNDLENERAADLFAAISDRQAHRRNFLLLGDDDLLRHPPDMFVVSVTQNCRHGDRRDLFSGIRAHGTDLLQQPKRIRRATCTRFP
jgi:hypothetical protein